MSTCLARAGVLAKNGNLMDNQAQVQDKKEQRILKQKIDVLERENTALKKSLYDLSSRFNASKTAQPLPLAQILTAPDIDILETDTAGARGGKFAVRGELRGHFGAVYCVRYSLGDGRFIASGSFDKTVRIWDSASLKEIHCLHGHSLNVSDVDWSATSDELLSGGYDQTCRVWDVEGRAIESVDSDGFVQCVQFNPTGTSGRSQFRSIDLSAD